jgi:excinuclease ABC subunit B
MKAHLDDLKKRMLDAAANLEFEEAARLRDEVRRLEASELAVAEDPLARSTGFESNIPAGKGRSMSGRPGTRQWRGKGKRRGR